MGMAGFLAAVTKAPLTAFIIVMEMVDGHSMVLSLMAAAMLASLVSRMISRPLYDTLAEHMVGRAISSTGSGGSTEPVHPTSPEAPVPKPAEPGHSP
jgi:H+/Cl- antiporter ClcA